MLEDLRDLEGKVGNVSWHGSCQALRSRASISDTLNLDSVAGIPCSSHGIGYFGAASGAGPNRSLPTPVDGSTRLDNKPKPFRFLNVWTSRMGLLDVIQEGWPHDLTNPPLGVLAAKLRTIKQVLKGWSKESFGDIFQAVKEAERAVSEAEIAQEQDSSDQALRGLNDARERLRSTLAIEEGFWRQRARAKWFQDGDSNSKYFHVVVSERRSRAIIHRIRGSNGDWLESEELISGEAIAFFQRLFTTESSFSSVDGLLDAIPKLVMDQDNNRLVELPSMAEVKEVVFSMDGESAAGPDGFTSKFFTFAWDVIAEDVHKALLPKIISPQQSGFVKGRQISDNFLLAQEIVTDIGKPSRGGNAVLKLDMMKAYDRVSWCFLLQVLRRFGFSKTWIDAIWRLALEKYCEASGQKINIQKSYFLVHPHLGPHRRRIISQVTGFQKREFPVRYLRCPLFIGRRKKAHYVEMCKGIVHKILSWKHRTLSPGRRVVLLKHVLSSMPIHLLAVASPPKGVLQGIERVMANFLWGKSDHGPHFHWMKWMDLCRPQGEGGLGLP
ncbi:uncharacterized protein [Coffea arabica]|uniref:Reverse transcriptase domain-containing protein n=1 Tax=Coffea arabica TaxID=13443 RepID=A0ABM4VUN2_COFAR